MKRSALLSLLLPLLLFALASVGRAQVPVPIVGPVSDAGGNVATSGIVQFDLQPQSSSIHYYVPGVEAIAPLTAQCSITSSGSLVQISNGVVTTTPCAIWGNDVISPANTTYTVTFMPNGTQTSSVPQECIEGTGPYSLASPVFCPVSQIIPQYNTITTPQVSANLIPITPHVYTLGNAQSSYAQAFIDNMVLKYLQIGGTITGPHVIAGPQSTVPATWVFDWTTPQTACSSIGCSGTNIKNLPGTDFGNKINLYGPSGTIFVPGNTTYTFSTPISTSQTGSQYLVINCENNTAVINFVGSGRMWTISNGNASTGGVFINNCSFSGSSSATDAFYLFDAQYFHLNYDIVTQFPNGACVHGQGMINGVINGSLLSNCQYGELLQDDSVNHVGSIGNILQNSTLTNNSLADWLDEGSSAADGGNTNNGAINTKFEQSSGLNVPLAIIEGTWGDYIQNSYLENTLANSTANLGMVYVGNASGSGVGSGTTQTAVNFRFTNNAMTTPRAGTGTAVTITGISESGTTVTVTSSLNPPVGQTVQITGSSVAGYNAIWTPTSSGSSSFQFTAPSGLATCSSTCGTAKIIYVTESLMVENSVALSTEGITDIGAPTYQQNYNASGSNTASYSGPSSVGWQAAAYNNCPVDAANYTYNGQPPCNSGWSGSSQGMLFLDLQTTTLGVSQNATVQGTITGANVNSTGDARDTNSLYVGDPVNGGAHGVILEPYTPGGSIFTINSIGNGFCVYSGSTPPTNQNSCIFVISNAGIVSIPEIAGSTQLVQTTSAGVLQGSGINPATVKSQLLASYTSPSPLTANTGPTAISAFTIPSTGHYRICMEEKISTAAAGSGAASVEPSLHALFTSSLDGTAGTNVQLGTGEGSTGNTTTVASGACGVFAINSGSTIQYQTTNYSSTGTTAMAYLFAIYVYSEN